MPLKFLEILKNLKKIKAGLILMVLISACAVPAWSNGNTTADAPGPIKKSVRKAPVRRPAKTQKTSSTKNTKKQAAPKAAPAQTAKSAAPASLNQGIALMQQERYEAARPWLLKAVQENRRSAAAWYWYGMYHEKTGNFYQAQYFYSKAVECDPTFEPLSRVAVYPDNGEKTPLWDPKRPARVYPVPTDSQGVAIIPPDAPQARTRPARPAIDPELPRVPVYVPPEPGAAPSDGDAWHPSVYVPPTMNEAANVRQEEGPVYVPPSAPAGISGPLTAAQVPAQARTPDVPVQPVEAVQVNQVPINTTPVYQPPEPPRQPAQTVSPVQAAVGQQEKKPAPAKTVKAAPAKTPAAKSAPRKIVKASPKKTVKADTKKVETKPQPAPRQPSRQTEPPAAAPRPVSRDVQPAAPQIRLDELPPVGQTAPALDLEEPVLPPVGQTVTD